MKKLQFVSLAAQTELRNLPPDVRRAIGFQLQRIQGGNMPADFKPMKIIGTGVYEIRVDDEQGNNVGRCFYVAKFGDTIWVLHSFVKKANRTPKSNIDIGTQRYSQLLERIRREKE
jgi:phage-related protein